MEELLERIVQFGQYFQDYNPIERVLIIRPKEKIHFVVDAINPDTYPFDYDVIEVETNDFDLYHGDVLVRTLLDYLHDEFPNACQTGITYDTIEEFITGWEHAEMVAIKIDENEPNPNGESLSRLEQRDTFVVISDYNGDYGEYLVLLGIRVPNPSPFMEKTYDFFNELYDKFL